MTTNVEDGEKPNQGQASHPSNKSIHEIKKYVLWIIV